VTIWSNPLSTHLCDYEEFSSVCPLPLLSSPAVHSNFYVVARQKYVRIVRFELIRCTRSSVLCINYLMSTSVADYGSHCNSHGSPSVCPVRSTESYWPKPRRKNAQGTPDRTAHNERRGARATRYFKFQFNMVGNDSIPD
jgi:hypothetical protein